PTPSLTLTAADFPADAPTSQLLSAAASELAAGHSSDALSLFDAALARDPSDYLALFKRGATYLSLGKTNQAQADFDRALALKPDFEGALLQRARLKARRADWAGARRDLKGVGAKGKEGERARKEIAELEEAQGAAALAYDAEAKGQWEECVSQAGVAVQVASQAVELRRLRARCRVEAGDTVEALADLQHVVGLAPGSVEPHLQISATTFYALGETEKGLSAIRKCLQSDPDSKECMKLMKREKKLEKGISKVKQMLERQQFASATRLLIPAGEDTGLLQDVKDDMKEYRAAGYIHGKATAGLYATLLEMTCEAYYQMGNMKKAAPYCTETLTLKSGSLYPLLAQARQFLVDDDFEAALRVLADAKDGGHGSHPEFTRLMREAQMLQRRSKEKDYYKVLGLKRDASEKEIRKAYRGLTKLYHPDKAAAQGISKEDAEKKMAAINEAYEVLSDPELKARFDAGDDPNNQEHGSPFGSGPGNQFFFKQGGGPFGGGGSGFKFASGGFGGFGGFP
ncbi:hypothetical protein BDY21DRAFT_268091, partial [Lineolata rhizophorae]